MVLDIALRHAQLLWDRNALLWRMIGNGIPRSPQKASLPRVLWHMTVVSGARFDFVHFSLALRIHLRRLLNHDRWHLASILHFAAESSITCEL